MEVRAEIATESKVESETEFEFEFALEFQSKLMLCECTLLTVAVSAAGLMENSQAKSKELCEALA